MLNESGISVAPPPRSRLAAPISLPAPPTQLSRHTCQRRSDAPVPPPNKKGDSESNKSDSDKTSDSGSDTSESGMTGSSVPNATQADDDDAGHVVVDDNGGPSPSHAEDDGGNTGNIIFIVDFLLLSMYFIVRFSEIYK